jgi:hypothetical protein
MISLRDCMKCVGDTECRAMPYGWARKPRQLETVEPNETTLENLEALTCIAHV